MLSPDAPAAGLPTTRKVQEEGCWVRLETNVNRQGSTPSGALLERNSIHRVHTEQGMIGGAYHRVAQLEESVPVSELHGGQGASQTQGVHARRLR